MAFVLVTREAMGHPLFWAGCVGMGLAISGMHYSVAIAIVASFAALRPRDGRRPGYGRHARDGAARGDCQSARRAVRQSDERLQLPVDRVQQYAILMLDPEGRVSSWNGGAQRIKGYEAKEIVGQHFSRFYNR
ncbi:MAG TPA: PAS domain S-box protein [Gemmatimonadales bacterium]|nr:PAS domain S-box protein [Gemmatimonadales bacterium]